MDWSSVLHHYHCDTHTHTHTHTHTYTHTHTHTHTHTGNVTGATPTGSARAVGKYHLAQESLYSAPPKSQCRYAPTRCPGSCCVFMCACVCACVCACPHAAFPIRLHFSTVDVCVCTHACARAPSLTHPLSHTHSTHTYMDARTGCTTCALRGRMGPVF